MLSYDKWKTLNESIFNGPMTLGLGKPATVLGVMGSRGGTEAAREVADLEALEEAKKKMKKKMFGGGGDDEEMDDDDGEMGDEKVVDDGNGDGDDDVIDMDSDSDSDDGECMGKKCGKGMKKKSKKEWSEYSALEALQAEMKEIGDKLAFLKGKKGDDSDGGDDSGDDKGDDKAMPFKKKGKDKDKKENLENMSSDDRAFWNSFSSMTDIDLDAKHWDGISVREDQLIEPPTNDGLEYKEPQPGDVGFAPNGKMGAGFTPADDGWKYDA